MTPTRLRECLNALQWSQRGIARVLDRQEGTIRQWARGVVRIPGDVSEWLETIMRCKPPVRQNNDRTHDNNRRIQVP